MSFTIEYKTNPSEKDWSKMTLEFSYFNKNLDDEQISMEIMEYVYTDPKTDDDEDYESNCYVKDMKSYINKVKVNFIKSTEQDKAHQEEFIMMGGSG